MEDILAKEVSLDDIVLSPRVVDEWLAKAADAVRELEGRVTIASIPDERARVNDDGTLTIFVEIPDILTISMEVPVGQWTYQQ